MINTNCFSFLHLSTSFYNNFYLLASHFLLLNESRIKLLGKAKSHLIKLTFMCLIN